MFYKHSWVIFISVKPFWWSTLQNSCLWNVSVMKCQSLLSGLMLSHCKQICEPFFFFNFFWSEDLEESWVFFCGSLRWNWRIYLRSKCEDQRHPEKVEVRGLSIALLKGGGGPCVSSAAGTVPLRSWRPVGGPARSTTRTFPADWKRTVGLHFLLYTGFFWRHQSQRSFFSLSSFPKH